MKDKVGKDTKNTSQTTPSPARNGSGADGKAPNNQPPLCRHCLARHDDSSESLCDEEAKALGRDDC